MIFHFTIFLWTVVFYLGLEVVAVNPIFPAWHWYIFSIVPLIIISLLASRRLTGRFRDAFLPGLIAVVVPTLLSLIDRPIERQIFVLVSAGMYYASLLGMYRLHYAPKDKTAQTILHTAALAALFFFYAGVYGFFLNFAFPRWGLMLLYFFGTALTSYSTFISLKKREPKRIRIYSTLLGLCLGELVWVMSFWPFGYLTTGALGLIFFFILWDITFASFSGQLSLNKVLIRLLIFLGLILLLLASSPWRILV